MNKVKISVKHDHGVVDGIYLNAGIDSPLVIIINGHNGFYNYGMFPYIQQKLGENGISSYSFNFSHGGINGDEDYFSDLEKYEKNCMRLETEDLLSVLSCNQPELNQHRKIIFLAHSLGGVPTIFGAKTALTQNIQLYGIILVSTVKTLRFWPPEMMKEWATNGVFYKKNNRTKQELPQGFEFLQEVMESDTIWNVENAIGSLNLPILIVHGEDDEAIPVEHAHSLYHWTKKNDNATLQLIPGGTHTFNTTHPFSGATPQLESLIKTCVDWIKGL